jgi:hypothetical protein
MKKIIAIVFILSLFAANAIYAGNDEGNGNPPAATTITGKVIDNMTSEELAGVTVQIEGTELKTYTDIEGNFTIEGLQPGNYDLKVSYISYKETELNNISVEPASKDLEIKLEQIK